MKERTREVYRFAAYDTQTSVEAEVRETVVVGSASNTFMPVYLTLETKINDT